MYTSERIMLRYNQMHHSEMTSLDGYSGLDSQTAVGDGDLSPFILENEAPNYMGNGVNVTL